MAIMKKLLILLLFIPYFGFSQGIKGSALTEATDINYNDYFFLIQSGTTKKVQFYRFSYNTDSAANQIQDSLVNYLAKIDSSDYVTVTRLNDSLYYYSSTMGLVDSLAKYTTKVMLNDSLTAYKWTEDSTATEPDIPNNTTAYWVDSDDSKYYLILDLAGTQKKLELL